MESDFSYSPGVFTLEVLIVLLGVYEHVLAEVWWVCLISLFLSLSETAKKFESF